MAKADVESQRRVLKAWVDENPLRLWRHQNEVSLMDAAIQIGVSLSTIQSWEKGVYLPQAGHARALEQMIGRGTQRRWTEWKSRQPTVAKAKAS